MALSGTLQHGVANTMGTTAKKTAASAKQALKYASGELVQPLGDSFLKKSNVTKVEEFLSVFNHFKTRLRNWGAKVNIERNLFGKKTLTIDYNGNAKQIYQGRDLESALKDGEKFSTLSKSLPAGATVISRHPSKLELMLPNRKPLLLQDVHKKRVFCEFYGSVPQYDYVGEEVDKFVEANKVIAKFKANRA